jgi:gliding motility-associated lipoprotein GldH
MRAKRLSRFILAAVMLLGIHSCGNIDVFEKNVSIPDEEWSSSFKPEIKFDISDTTSLYNIYVVLRHTNAYRYNNIWLNIYTQSPADSVHKERLELRLATDDKGWLGSGMDDIFEHRILVNRGQPLRFPRSGEYTFRLEQIMREEPLQYVMNVGIRVEKVKS